MHVFLFACLTFTLWFHSRTAEHASIHTLFKGFVKDRNKLFDGGIRHSASLRLQECSWASRSGLEALLVSIWRSRCGSSWQA